MIQTDLRLELKLPNHTDRRRELSLPIFSAARGFA